ncbi:MAG: hydrogenase, partial [Deltaproteobacteria bacterium]|nr:hydrogenase [Deltaproteobacteria bacterium]
ATALIGIYMIIARKNVLSQLIGYLVLENAGFLLALSVAVSQPFFVEIGVMLDVFMGVIIMTTAMHQIYAEHETYSSDSLERLKQ